jgi:hypothetical protein
MEFRTIIKSNNTKTVPFGKSAKKRMGMRSFLGFAPRAAFDFGIAILCEKQNIVAKTLHIFSS